MQGLTSSLSSPKIVLSFAIIMDGNEVNNLSPSVDMTNREGTVTIAAAVFPGSGQHTLAIKGSNMVSQMLSPSSTITLVPTLSGLSLAVAQPVYGVGQQVSITGGLQAGGFFSYTLEYGDGQKIQGQVDSIVTDHAFLSDSLSHSYSSTGEYAILMTVTDDITSLEATAKVTIQGKKK